MVTVTLAPCPASRIQLTRRPALPKLRCVSPKAARHQSLVVRAERGGGGFWPGFIVGGTIFGVLGFVFAPQISKALLGEDQRLKLPRFLEEQEDPEVTKQNLADKIAQLNAAIDDVSSQLKANDATLVKEEASA